MKVKNWVIALAGVFVFYILTRFIPVSKTGAGTVNYAPNGFSKTIEAPINGVVRETRQEGLFWVGFDNDIKLPFSYVAAYLPENAGSNYPKNFILVGDSIVKNANSEIYYVFRGASKWKYHLPKQYHN